MSKDQVAFSQREFPMTDSDFKSIQKIAYENTGISISDHKKDMIYSRISRRVRHLDLDNFSQYCQEIKRSGNAEINEFINSITTNLTSFFREYHHFEYLLNTVFPYILKTHKTDKRVRIWSAGCSTGEEPYSIAMTIHESGLFKGWDIKILASDLDSNVVSTGASGVYPCDRVEKIPDKYIKYIDGGLEGNKAEMPEIIKSYISFKQLNLLNPWKMKGPFDVIFCRNVVIYFDIETQKKLFDRYADMLSENGTLFIGHSETLHNVSDRFNAVGRTTYQRIA